MGFYVTPVTREYREGKGDKRAQQRQHRGASRGVDRRKQMSGVSV